VPVVVALVAGPGVTSPKNRLSGCETGHAGLESFLLVLPDPRKFQRAMRLASTMSWR